VTLTSELDLHMAKRNQRAKSKLTQLVIKILSCRTHTVPIAVPGPLNWSLTVPTLDAQQQYFVSIWQSLLVVK